MHSSFLLIQIEYDITSLSVMIDNIVLEKFNSTTFVGLFIDKKLACTEHIMDYITSKITINIYIEKYQKHIVPL